MSVISVQEKYGPRSGDENQKLEAKYQRTFQVTTDDRFDTASTVLGAIGVLIGDEFPNDPTAFCINRHVEGTGENGLVWDATLDYGKWEQLPQNPFNEPAELSGGFQQFEEEFDVDINGKPVVNRAGDPFLESLKRDDSRPVLRITKKFPSFSFLTAWFYKDAINRVAFQGAPPGTCKVSNISFTRYFDQNWGYVFPTTVEIAFNGKGWQKRPLNIGLRELKAGKRQHILIKGQPATDPVPLDMNGKVLPPGVPPIALTFDAYPKADFSIFSSWMA